MLTGFESWLVGGSACCGFASRWLEQGVGFVLILSWGIVLNLQWYLNIIPRIMLTGWSEGVPVVGLSPGGWNKESDSF
jgi:hypothetical protein